MARSTFFYQKKVLEAGDKDAQVKEEIQAEFHRHHGRYGYRRITAALRQAGRIINHKAVQRLMGELGLKSLVRPKKYKSYKADAMEASEDVLQRDFEADRPNEKWVTDVTEFKVAGRKVYLSPIMDLYNREIVAYEIRERPSLDLVSDMLEQAMGKLTEHDRPILHSDQGWQGGFNWSSQHPKSRRCLWDDQRDGCTSLRGEVQCAHQVHHRIAGKPSGGSGSK